jgi:hypothetical protein
MTETETESYWKKPDPQAKEAERQEPSVGVWSRSHTLRVSVWIGTLILALFLALVVSAYLSGFNSVLEMIDWLRESLPKM